MFDHSQGGAGESGQRLLDDLAVQLEARVPGSLGHGRRVALYSASVATRLDLGEEAIARIHRAAGLHDIGKIETPVELVNRPGPLSDEEFAVVQRHPSDGAALVSRLGDGELAAIVRHHHERVDGGGYPDGLIGEEIPLGARIVAVADTFDAVASRRPYRPAMQRQRALALLDGEAGTQLDPSLVSAFRECCLESELLAAIELEGEAARPVAFPG